MNVKVYIYRRLSIVIVCALAQPQFLASQTSAPEAENHRQYCELVTTRLTRSTSQKEHSHLLTSLQSCPASLVIPVLLSEWRNPSRDSTTMQVLAKTTGQFRDQRLVDAVLQTAVNANLSRSMRVASFHALITYIDPHSIAIFRNLDKEGLTGRRYVLMGTIDHIVSESGPVPIKESAPREILRALTDVGVNDPDNTIRKIAGYLSEELSGRGKK